MSFVCMQFSAKPVVSDKKKIQKKFKNGINDISLLLTSVQKV